MDGLWEANSRSGTHDRLYAYLNLYLDSGVSDVDTNLGIYFYNKQLKLVIRDT